MFRIIGHVNVDEVLPIYSDLYAAGHHEGERPDVQLDILRKHGREWVLANVPLVALDYQTVEDSGEARVARARTYAARGGAFPPGIAVYGGRSQRRRTGRGYVVDGNHRVLAATMRGDCAIRMFMPAGDYGRLVEDVAT